MIIWQKSKWKQMWFWWLPSPNHNISRSYFKSCRLLWLKIFRETDPGWCLLPWLLFLVLSISLSSGPGLVLWSVTGALWNVGIISLFAKLCIICSRAVRAFNSCSVDPTSVKYLKWENNFKNKKNHRDLTVYWEWLTFPVRKINFINDSSAGLACGMARDCCEWENIHVRR